MEKRVGGKIRIGYAWAISAGFNAAFAAIAAKFFSDSQFVKYGFIIFFNVMMWGCYVNSLKALSSLQATVTNFATNFLSSGLAGFFLFNETISTKNPNFFKTVLKLPKRSNTEQIEVVAAEKKKEEMVVEENKEELVIQENKEEGALGEKNEEEKEEVIVEEEKEVVVEEEKEREEVVVDDKNEKVVVAVEEEKEEVVEEKNEEEAPVEVQKKESEIGKKS
ncbi:Cell growth defect factor [Thalictrum thalictroides]|uniref:Cell growth defect factor n=1 Tax=Thalictrum thalictroides TaxID=46969 RepID=A0A7J6V718_THATH|nr:Cell growth defect factor [Thalictrum thalictroides]